MANLQEEIWQTHLAKPKSTLQMRNRRCCAVSACMLVRGRVLRRERLHDLVMVVVTSN